MCVDSNEPVKFYHYYYTISTLCVYLQILIHIADAPCHGTMYHSESYGIDDTYPNGDPAGISHENMMQQVVRLDIQYWFGYINKQYTDQMIRIFSECLKQLSDYRLLIRQFDAIQPNEVGEAVKRLVCDVFSGLMLLIYIVTVDLVLYI